MSAIPSKIVGRQCYLHVESLEQLDTETLARLVAAERLADVRRQAQFNLVRLDAEGARIALLNYPEFDEDPFPALRESWLVDLAAGTLSYRTYADSLNPPILHRKELFLPPEHPRRAKYAALTAACESVGLFDDPRRIGYRRQWLALIRERGYRLDGHALLPLGNDESDTAPPETDTDATDTRLQPGWQAARHRTALTRYGFSAPIQSLARHGFLDGRYRLFDYGCGRGDDVRGLIENGLEAGGWDPYHAPDQPVQAADIVNLGFVINVIEDFDERLEALTRAWSLAERLLVVSVMLANQNDPRGTRFRDGVMTKRGTFQKYFTPSEIKTFLDQALDEEAIPVAPGVLYVFRDKDAEQRFLVDRSRRRRQPLRAPSPRLREPVSREPRARRDRAAEREAAWREPLERLWALWLSLGRPPEKSEVGEDLLALTEGFGSLAKARRFLESRRDPAELEQAARARRDDLLVYLALQQFERRRPYRHLERGLQQDIKHFFGDYAAARAEASEWLFRIADIGALEDACRAAAEQGLGGLDPGRSLQLHASLVERLPPVLRLYVGCAAVLYGDYHQADLVKIHIASGKVSLMRYDDFAGQALPRLIERVKIRLRDLDIDYFAYGEAYEPPFLYRKSRYINEEFEHYPEQLAFDQALDDLELFDLSRYGPPPALFRETLAQRRWTIEGFELTRPRTRPALDDPCGRFLTFRQLIECGETQAHTGLANLPRRPESYDALLELAEQVLDPVIEYFGMIRLTYGFCSPELARQIPGRIDPKRDQHAAHEHNRLGRPICARLGAAVDFLVEDECMLEVAQWIVANTPFDRLYVYGDDQPIHVSYGPNQDRQIVRMVATQDGRLVPRVVSAETFLAD
ncbi:DNA phosphorothioation-associated putative methyltransferase [Allochromatium palmeri]|uniref:DNA phosphorothioation-associated putative methyltransferase n=1 Tax=Allochromatium palmeri TaxID=231048 RepID=A0A6N8EB06_9GAMM|nr:DNA phosphorothioation-associated putative methyltransferase [Allochromatium palmeri]MTW19727.1 DNA phosphorothioation-associated putative methyltransferase [Allochromatium palmeri]